MAEGTSQQQQMENKAPEKSSLGLTKEDLITMENELQCSICTELFIKAVTLNCSHTFCKYCINEWKKSRSICPICREEIRSECPTLVLDTYIDKVLDNIGNDAQEKRKAVVTQREKDTKESEQAAGNNTGNRHNQQARNDLNIFINGVGFSIDLDSNESDDDDDDYSFFESDADEDEEDDWNEDEWDPFEDEMGNYAGEEEEEEEDEENVESHDDEQESSNEEASGQSESSRDEMDDNTLTTVSGYNGIQGAYYGGYGHCFHCGNVGHWANGCPQRVGLTCFNCGQEGHFQKACPDRQVTCNYCGEMGHRAANCHAS